MTELRNEIKTLQGDNLKLYEKVRYLESYSASSGSGGPSSLRSLVGNNRRDEELGKYRNMYEDSMNPFEAFKGRVGRRLLQPSMLAGRYSSVQYTEKTPCLRCSVSCLQEQSRAVGNLNPLEKMLFTFSTVVLGNRYMRNLFVLYALGVHIFLFFSIWGS